MVNTLVVSKSPASGEYSTIQAAIDDLPTGSWTEPQVIVVKTGTYAELLDVSDAGSPGSYTPSATNFLTIRGENYLPGHVNGTQAWAKLAPSSGTGNGHCIDVQLDYTVIERLEITRASGGTTSDEAVRVNADNITVRHNIIHDLTVSQMDAIYCEISATVNVIGNIIYGIRRAAIDAYLGAGIETQTWNIYNNTIVGNKYGVWIRSMTADDTVTLNAWNNVVVSNTTNDFQNDNQIDTHTGGHNLQVSGDTESEWVGFGSPTCVVGDVAALPSGDRWIVFEETGTNPDYRLAHAARNAALKHGIGYNEDAWVPTTDITGAAYPNGAWTDCGAHLLSKAGQLVTYAVSTHDLNNSTGAQVLTQPEGYLQPVAAIVITSHAGSDSTNAADAGMTIGLTDGRRAALIMGHDTDDLADTESRKIQSASTSDWLCADLTDASGANVNFNGQADFLHFTSEGMVLNIVEAFPDTNRVMVMWFHGSDALFNLVYEGSFSSTLNGTTNVAVPALTAPNGCLVIAADNGTESTANHAHYTFGGAFDDGSSGPIEQGSCAYWSESDRAFGVHTTLWSDEHVATFHSGTSAQQALEVTDMAPVSGASNIEFTTRDQATASIAWVMGIQLPDGVSMSIKNWTSPSTTGDDAHTGAGFEPSAGVLMLTDNTNAKDTPWVSGGGFGVSFLYGTSSSHTMHIRGDTLADPSICKSRSEPDIYFIEKDGTVTHDGTLSSWDSDGFTLNFPSTASEALEGVWILFQEETAAATPTTITPDAVSVTINAPAQTASVGTVTVAPNAVAVQIDTPQAGTALGAATVAPNSVAVQLDAPQAGTSLGTATVSPDPVQVPLIAPAASPTPGPLALAPGAVPIPLALPGISLGVGATSVSPGPVSLPILAPSPALAPGSVLVGPDPVQVPIVVPTQSVGAGTVITPDGVPIPLVVPGTSLSLGGVTIAPNPVEIPIAPVGPQMALGSVSISPDAVSIQISPQAAEAVMGAVTANPDAVAVVMVVPEALVGAGTGVQPSPVPIPIVVPAVSLIQGQVVLAPDSLEIPLVVPAATVGSITVITPSPVPISLDVQQAVIAPGALSLQPDPVEIPIEIAQAALAPAGISLAPDAVAIAVGVPEATLDFGTSILASALEIPIVVPEVGIVLGGTLVSPNPVAMPIAVPLHSLVTVALTSNELDAGAIYIMRRSEVSADVRRVPAVESYIVQTPDTELHRP